MIEDFLTHLRGAGYSDSTLEISKRWLNNFSTRIPKPLNKLCTQDLTTYDQALRWEPGPKGKLYSENTRNQAIGVLKAYFRWCVENGHIQKDPSTHLTTRRVPEPEKVSLTPGQVRAVLELTDISTHAGLRHRVCLGLLIENQASPAALSRLDLADFQPDTGALMLRGRTRRIVSLSTGLQADLERYLRLGRAGVANPDEQALFVSRDGCRLCSAAHGTYLRQLCERAGVPRPHFIS